MSRTQTRWLMWTVPALAVGLLVLPASGAEPKDVALPKRPEAVQADLVKALENRKSVRDYRPDRLTMQDLSALLWAANGVNRDYGRRTAPSAFGNDYIDLYVVGDEGAWRYDAPAHRLRAVAPGGLKGTPHGPAFRRAGLARARAGGRPAEVPRLFRGQRGAIAVGSRHGGGHRAERLPHGGGPGHRDLPRGGCRRGCDPQGAGSPGRGDPPLRDAAGLRGKIGAPGGRHPAPRPARAIAGLSRCGECAMGASSRPVHGPRQKENE